MENFLYGTSAVLKLIIPFALAIWWCRKRGGRLYPVLVGFFAYFLVSLVRGAIRSGLSRNDPTMFNFAQSALTAVLEESARFLVFTYVLKSYDTYKDAVSCGIGHAALEIIGDGFGTFEMVGLYEGDKPAYGFLWLLRDGIAVSSGFLFHIALTVIILWGIRQMTTRYALPSAIMIHFLADFIRSFMGFAPALIFQGIIAAALVFAAHKLVKSDNYSY